MKTDHKKQLTVFLLIALLFCAAGIVFLCFGLRFRQPRSSQGRLVYGPVVRRDHALRYGSGGDFSSAAYALAIVEVGQPAGE